MINKIRTIILSILAIAFVSAVPAHAQGGFTNIFGGGGGSGSGGLKCGETQTHLIGCDGATGVGAIADRIGITIFIMTLLIGLVATGGLVYGAFLYATAGDDRDKVSQAVTVIRNVIIGLIFYAFTVGIISWLIPNSPIEQTDPSQSPSASASVSPSSSP